MLAVAVTRAVRAIGMSALLSRSTSPYDPTDGSFGAVVCPTLAAYLSGDSAVSASVVAECFQKARTSLPYLFCQSTSLSSMTREGPKLESSSSARIVNAQTGDRVVVIACDSDGRPHCFDEQDGRDTVKSCRWPIGRRLYTIKHYYFFVGLMSADRESFRCYAVWTMAGLFVGDPIATRICEHLGIDLAPAVTVAEAIACAQPYLFCANHQPPKIVLPRPHS
jgi:hypothetical protein